MNYLIELFTKVFQTLIIVKIVSLQSIFDGNKHD